MNFLPCSTDSKPKKTNWVVVVLQQKTSTGVLLIGLKQIYKLYRVLLLLLDRVAATRFSPLSVVPSGRRIAPV